MTYASARWGDAEQSVIIAMRADGAAASIPADAANTDYLRITQGDEAAGQAVLMIAPYQRWPDLVAAKAELRVAVYAEANARVDALTTDGEADPARRREQIMMAAISITRKEVAGETLSAAEETLKAIALYAEAATTDIRIAEAVKKAEIDALADLAAAEAYDVAAGWPE